MVKNLPANVGDTGDTGWIPTYRGSPGVGNGNPLQYPCLENPMDTGAPWATVHGVAKSQTRLSARTHTHTHTHSLSAVSLAHWKCSVAICAASTWTFPSHRLLFDSNGLLHANFKFPNLSFWTNSSYFKKMFFKWNAIALQCNVGFCYITTWINYLYTHIPFLLSLPPAPTILPI